MKIILAGGSGFLGRALAASLTGAGHTVVVLTRTSSTADRAGAGASPAGSASPGGRRPTPPTDTSPAASAHAPAPVRVTWIPDGTVGPWADACAGAGAIVNLAGESIAARRWSSPQKARLWQSRAAATESLTSLIARMNPPPGVFVSSSAIGYYGSRGETLLTEADGAGPDFLAELALEWEQLARRAAATTRVVLVRTGIVLDPHEGALGKMLLPFRLGLGGRMGSGRQFMSWIHRDDWVALVRWIIETPGISGPVNATAPNPVTNAAFASALGHALGRPALLPVPACVLHMALGEMAGPLLLSSQRVVPEVASGAGFRFRFETLDAALADLLGR